MHNQFIPRATSRARWLVELSAALDEAQILLAQLVAERIGEADAESLRVQIVELRTQLRLLNRRSVAPERMVEAPRLVHPDWSPRRD